MSKQKVKNTTRMKIEGAGPRIMVPLFVTFAITAWISYTYQPTFNYPLVPAEWTLVLGTLFLLVGVPFWLLSTGMFLVAYFQGRLETRGPYAVMLNPIYGSWVVFVLPGISLVLNWWPILLASVVMYVAQRLFIHEEDELLRQKFGGLYEEYRKNVLITFL
jgi:protein-S-isoprenylcysteine O-methyltransferase Ste14